MALDHPALLELFEALRLAGVDDRVRSAGETLYQALLDAELTAVIGAHAASAHRQPHGSAQRQPPPDVEYDRCRS